MFLRRLWTPAFLRVFLPVLGFKACVCCLWITLSGFLGTGLNGVAVRAGREMPTAVTKRRLSECTVVCLQCILPVDFCL